MSEEKPLPKSKLFFKFKPGKGMSLLSLVRIVEGMGWLIDEEGFNKLHPTVKQYFIQGKTDSMGVFTPDGGPTLDQMRKKVEEINKRTGLIREVKANENGKQSDNDVEVASETTDSKLP